MRAIRKEDLENITYYQVPKWLFDLLLNGEITPGAFSLYVLMYERTRMSAKNNWIDANGDVYIKYSYNEMLDDLKVKSRTQIKRNIDKLVELELIDKKRNFSSSSTFYLNIYTEKAEKTMDVTKSTQSGTNGTLSSSTQNVSISSTQNVYSNKNKYNKNNLIRTTTKLDNINYIDQPSNEVDEVSSSLLEIKEFLSERVKDVQTCKNIMRLVDKGLTLPRIKEVVEYSDKNNKGLGFIYQALENCWNLKEEKQEPRPRGHKQNFEAMEKHEESKKENQDFKNKLKSLDELYNSLTKSQQKEIDDIAIKRATELFGKFIAPTMARTKVKYEVLEELLSMEQEEIA